MPARPRNSPTKTTNGKPSRPVDDGTLTFLKVRGGDKSRRYSLIADGDAVDEYMDMGWEPVLWDIDEKGAPRGPHIKSGRPSERKHGAEIKARGHLLMSISNERWEEIQEEGPYGGGGRKASREIARRIMDPNHGNPMRGVGPYVSLVAEQGHGVRQVTG